MFGIHNRDAREFTPTRYIHILNCRYRSRLLKTFSFWLRNLHRVFHRANQRSINVSGRLERVSQLFYSFLMGRNALKSISTTDVCRFMSTSYEQRINHLFMVAMTIISGHFYLYGKSLVCGSAIVANSMGNLPSLLWQRFRKSLLWNASIAIRRANIFG